MPQAPASYLAGASVQHLALNTACTTLCWTSYCGTWQGKRLDAKRAHRDSIAKEADAKHAFLDGLAQQLKTAANEVDAVCLKLGIPPAMPGPQSVRLASLLPQPLFTLYWQLLSAISAFNLGLQASITGQTALYSYPNVLPAACAAIGRKSLASV